MVTEGAIAIVHFTGRIAIDEDAGEVFDTTDVDTALEAGIYHDYRDYKPIEVRVGNGAVVQGLDEALLGMAAGERRTIQIPPEKGFGRRDASKVIEIAHRDLPDVGIEEGKLVRTETGETGWIIATDDDIATIDFNHELAGRSLEFEICILDIHGGPDKT